VLLFILGIKSSVPPNTEVDMRLCFLLRGQQDTIHQTHCRGLIYCILWSWQSISYFYFGSFPEM